MKDTHKRKTSAENLRENIDLAKFKHSLASRVRTYDVDRQNIVHNAVYLYWLEVGRIEYFRSLGLPIDAQTFVTKHHFVVAHVEIDYLGAARFDDEYEVLTRTVFMKNSSFGIEQIIRLINGDILLHANAVIVNLNPARQTSERISDSYRKLVQEFEGADMAILTDEKKA